MENLSLYGRTGGGGGHSQQQQQQQAQPGVMYAQGPNHHVSIRPS
jgi:hypothetical protein